MAQAGTSESFWNDLHQLADDNQHQLTDAATDPVQLAEEIYRRH